ncbi:receptor-like protein 33 [Gossypium hirsutum]|uniref:Receptor-like protein 33 n=1 Tax=Gossypium hirsutum TaxID=3635 RepID=A0A1U8NMJ5_GOSHI|nr:receptor-like protein 33 [Gossypium hirsutum]
MSNGRGSQPPFSGLIWATEKNPPMARPRGSGFDESDGTRPEVAVLRQQRRQWVTDFWDEGTDRCKWKGVVCDNKKGNMIGLDLSCGISLQNLRWLNLAVNDFGNSEIPSDFGNFPTQLFHLPYLQNIILSSNPDLIGYLPETNWSSPLSLLDVSGTRFSKGLPGSIDNLKHLKKLNLDSCVFTRSIPSSLGNLTKITFLDISGNMFQGQIPDVFGNLNDLSFMGFSSNNFSGLFPSLAFNLTSLTFMDFSSNFLRGTLPNNISGLSYLRELHLYANLLSGRVPGWLFSLQSLEYLDLHSNKLNGPIDPIQEANLVQLVDLSKNEIQGTIPSSFIDLMNLTILDLSSNNLSGNIKSCMLVKLKNLRSLDVSFNNLLSLTRSSNDVNSTLPMIIEFRFSSCNMQPFPSFLNASKSLQLLDLYNNQIHGSITK